MKPSGDRRVRGRFEVVGSLRGSFEVGECADLVNISKDGALLASPLALAVESVQTLHLTVSQHEARVDARVCHLRQMPAEAGRSTYLIGLEFLSPPASILEAIEWLAEWADRAPDLE